MTPRLFWIPVSTWPSSAATEQAWLQRAVRGRLAALVIVPVPSGAAGEVELSDNDRLCHPGPGPTQGPREILAIPHVRAYPRDSIMKTALFKLMLAVAVSIAFVLPAEAQNGVLKVTSFPSGAAVAVDGAPTRKITPMSVTIS